jgi:streptogramin lyase
MEPNRALRNLFVLVLLLSATVFAASLGSAADDSDYLYMNEYPLPQGVGTPERIVAEAPGQVWFTLRQGTHQLGKLTVTGSPPHPDFDLYQLPGRPEPAAIAYTSEPNYVWLTVPATNALVRLDPQDGSTKDYGLPEPGSQPAGIAVAPDGTLWIASTGANQVLRFNPAVEEFTQYSYTAGNAGITEIAVYDDDTVYFSAANLERAVRLTPSVYPASPDDSFTPMTLCDPFSQSCGQPGQLAVNESHHIWVVDSVRNWIGQFIPGTFTTWRWQPVPPAGVTPYGLALSQIGSVNVVWFTLPDVGVVGHLGKNAEGVLFIREHTIPAAGSVPRSIAVDSQNHGWIAVAGSNLIAEWVPDYNFGTYLPIIPRN